MKNYKNLSNTEKLEALRKHNFTRKQITTRNKIMSTQPNYEKDEYIETPRGTFRFGFNSMEDVNRHAKVTRHVHLKVTHLGVTV